MERKRPASEYAGALAQPICLDRKEPVDQAMERILRKIPLLFEHYKVDPHDKNCWQPLAVRLALAHVPGLKLSMRRGGRKRTWKAGQGDELVRAVEDVQSRMGVGKQDALRKLHKDKLGKWKGYTVENLGSRYREAKRFQEPPGAWTPSLKAAALRRFQEWLREVLEDLALEPVLEDLALEPPSR
jgi:hypothetical protein